METATKTARTEPATNHHADRSPTQDVMEYLREYAREKPEAAAMWCFGIGFVLGWKLKLW